jgi:hypothetical protein
MVPSFYWVIPRRLNFIFRRFGTRCPTFIGGVSRKAVQAGRILPAYTTYEDGTDSLFRNVGKLNSDAGKSPKRKNTTLRTQGKFEIKNISFMLY